MDKKEFMIRAISLSKANIENGGGPFGAVVVKDNIIISTGVNKVVQYNDPTAHAEIVAIREAAKKLNSFNLRGCEIYSSCEPCPMCLSAIYWARIDKVFFGCTKEDAQSVGFIDNDIYHELGLADDEKKIEATQLMRDEAYDAFRLWADKSDKVEY